MERLSFDQKSVTSSETSSADIQPSNDMPKRRPSSASENSEEMQTAFMGDDEKHRVTELTEQKVYFDNNQVSKSAQKSSIGEELAELLRYLFLSVSTKESERST